MSSNHYLENLDSRYAVKTEAEILYPRVSAAEFFGRQAVQLANTAAAAAATNAAPAHSNSNLHHLQHTAVSSNPPPASPAHHHHHHGSHQQLHHSSSISNHNHQHQQQQQQHHHNPHHHPPPPHGYVTFTTQILDAVNLAPGSVYHSAASPGGSSPSLMSLASAITAKEEPVEISTMSPATTTSAVKRRRPHKPANKQFACDKCAFRTAARGNLNLHENSVHLKIKHPCDQCKYEATQVTKLNEFVV